MEARAILLAAALSSSVVSAQEPRTGVSRPEADTIDVTQDAAAHPSLQPKTPATAEREVFGPYVPYQPPTSSRTEERKQTAEDADGTIVTSVDELPGELREGTLLRARILQSVSTLNAEAGSNFSASLAEPVLNDGRVVFPQGAMLHGKITAVRSGRRISGPAMLHLEVKGIDLPDGTQFALRATLIDTDQSNATSVDREGSLVRRDHPKETLAAMGVAIGGATAAGAVVGGGVGALVGAGIGLGAGTVVWLREDRQASVAANTLLVFSLSAPTPTVARSPAEQLTVSTEDRQVVGDPGAGRR